MSLISYTSKELNLLARLMRAEALSDGNSDMLMVGDVAINSFILLLMIYGFMIQDQGIHLISLFI